jgi:hypothetical protein
MKAGNYWVSPIVEDDVKSIGFEESRKLFASDKYRHEKIDNYIKVEQKKKDNTIDIKIQQEYILQNHYPQVKTPAGKK